MVAPAAMPVLSDDRAGVGGATMIGVATTTGGGGGGGGGGGAANWARADVGANAMVSAKAIATATANPCASPGPAPVFLKCKGVAERRINIIPKKAQLGRKIAKSPSAGADLRPVIPERQSVMVPAAGRLAVIVVPQPQLVGGRSRPAGRFPRRGLFW
jgi:hypothetical protein